MIDQFVTMTISALIRFILVLGNRNAYNVCDIAGKLVIDVKRKS